MGHIVIIIHRSIYGVGVMGTWGWGHMAMGTWAMGIGSLILQGSLPNSQDTPLPMCPIAHVSKRCQNVNQMSNVKKSNTQTMEEVHKKIN